MSSFSVYTNMLTAVILLCFLSAATTITTEAAAGGTTTTTDPSAGSAKTTIDPETQKKLEEVKPKIQRYTGFLNLDKLNLEELEASLKQTTTTTTEAAAGGTTTTTDPSAGSELEEVKPKIQRYTGFLNLDKLNLEELEASLKQTTITTTEAAAGGTTTTTDPSAGSELEDNEKTLQKYTGYLNLDKRNLEELEASLKQIVP